tara:strand:- start:1520 stop:2464 length:945 start_codon:yes stop_codon:yes gene_type:complete
VELISDNMLQEIITDTNLVWDKSSFKTTFLVDISNESINELLDNRNKLANLDIRLPKFQNEILNFKRDFLLDGIGFFVINGKCFDDFTNEELIEIYRIIGTYLGTLYTQNIKNEKLVKIQDEGKSMKTGGRYHQTREGGSFHTDSPQWTRVPDFIGLCCINPAKKGGESKFVSAYKIHNEMLKTHQDYLSILYEKFHFDKRGEFVDGESPTVFEPIFKFEKNFLKCRYLRNYIDDGHSLQKIPLNEKQKQALDYLDEIIHDENNSAEYNLKKNDVVFFNNNRIIHGRTSFEDFDEPEKKRLMIRAWVKNDLSHI